ncbi:MAG: nicotinamide-nucleotide amidase [Flavobacteriaceae bacterium]|jgi:nicotinamide-nucleotide amidase|uniref:CinA family nicotinamide mononucleotide deamidase-related protein n=1 Tax=Candidatus Marifrigoribacter sp. Uisw_064 TaxID=3230970 RepID=UPI003ADB1AAA
MLAELITIGDEILIGQITDTNSVFMAQELNKIGVQVHQITSIQDDEKHILDALSEAEKRVDIVLVTGGLGPTKDDITKQTFCTYFNDSLIENKEVLIHIKDLFKKYTKHSLLPDNINQALVPSKARILKNSYGTAPGMWMEKNNTVFISMPGVPYEMKHLMKREVLPLIASKFNCPFIYHKTLLTFGMGESEIAKRIYVWEKQLPNTIKLAYLPSLGRVRLRLSSKGINEKEVKEGVDSLMKQLQNKLEDIAIGYEDETSIEERIAILLNQKKYTLSVTESCTGGALTEKITAKAGASTFFMGSTIPYGTKFKTKLLGVKKETILAHNVASYQVAEEMAIQSNILFETDFSVATTGIAGPTIGEAKDEVGTVYVAIASPRGVYSEKFNFGKPRERVIEKAVFKALELLLKEILKN